VLAGIRNAFHHLLCDCRIQHPGRQVIHEKQWRGALHGDVIDAVVHQVSANGGMQAHLEGNFELGSHAVHARDQHRVQILDFVHRKQAAEAAYLAQHPPRKGLMR
jgi:hypothetical protein